MSKILAIGKTEQNPNNYHVSDVNLVQSYHIDLE